MTEPTDDLRRGMAKAIMISPGRNWLDFADAAIAAYRQHPDGAARDRENLAAQEAERWSGALRTISENAEARQKAEAERDAHAARVADLESAMRGAMVVQKELQAEWAATARHQLDAQALLEKTVAERDEYKSLLVRVVNEGTYGGASDDVSLEFLRHVPDEVTAMRVRLEAERDAAYEQARAHEAKWETLCKLTNGTCACSYDKKDDVCALHSPQLVAALAERDEARARFNDIDLCRMGQAPCETMLAAERTAYTAGWIAGRDAAAAEAHVRHWPSSFGHNDVARSIADAIRALTPEAAP